MSTEPSHDTKGNSASEDAAKERNNNRLPFEPQKKRKKAAKTQPEPVPSKTAKTQPKSTPSKTSPKTASKKDQAKPAALAKNSMAIPDAVSKRMIRRMALLCGIPSFLGIATFFVSYFLVTSVGLKFPHVAVVLVSMGFFGLGVLGLSYGVLSASWDEDVPGSVVGWQEFTTNWGRMTSAWRSAGQKD